MEELAPVCLAATCVLTPVLIGFFLSAVYLLGVGSVKIPGISRGEHREGKDWSTLTELTHKATKTLGAGISVVGAFFGLIGFLLPWVEIDIGAGASVFDLGGLQGSLTGIAFMLQSFLTGIGVFSIDADGAAIVGALLMGISLFVALIPFVLLITSALALGMVASPMGLIKANVKRLSRPLLLLSVVALCLSCTFFAGMQGTVGGIKLGGSESVFGTAFTVGVGVTNGFWVTVGGLLLVVVGALLERNLASRIGSWAESLSKLDREEED